MDNEMNDSIDDLDNTWLNEFENLDNNYKHYYTEDITFIRIHSVYVNKDNTVEKIKEEKIFLKTPNILPKDDLLTIIKRNSFSNNIKYSLLSILKINVNIEPQHLTNFLKSKDKNIGNHFLQSVKNIDNIKFDKTISMFQDINDIIILFHQKVIYPQSLRNRTKKIFINSNTKRKTKKKELKETNI
jgi:hypothetical protein